jgi:hypothetical protein
MGGSSPVELPSGLEVAVGLRISVPKRAKVPVADAIGLEAKGDSSPDIIRVKLPNSLFAN